MKKVLVIATKVEASPFIAGFKMKKMENNYFPIYYNDDCYLIVCGIGKVAAALAATYMVLTFEADILYNFGAAGSLKQEHGVSEVLHVESVWESDRPLFAEHKLRFIKTNVFDDFKTVVLASQDHAVLSDKERSEFSKYADLVDMEAAGFINVCKKFNKPGYIFKIVSDSIVETNKELIMAQIKKVSTLIYQYVVDKKILTFE
jgi:adenosylhomocysteine nucleosidase